MIKAFFEIYNWRFWWFMFIVCFPFIFGIIGNIVVLIQERRNEDE